MLWAFRDPPRRPVLGLSLAGHKLLIWGANVLSVGTAGCPSLGVPITDLPRMSTIRYGPSRLALQGWQIVDEPAKPSVTKMGGGGGGGGGEGSFAFPMLVSCNASTKRHLFIFTMLFFLSYLVSAHF